MKKKIVLLISILLLSGCSIYDEYKMPNGVELKVKNKTYKVYSKHKIKELVKKNNVKITNLDEVINTKKIGTHSAIIEYKYKLWKHKYKVTYKVVDEVAPTMITYKESFYTNINEDVNFCSNTIFIDNYDKSPKCSIEGNYSLSEEGNYDLNYIIKDNSDNKTTVSFNLTVGEPEDSEEEITETNEQNDEFFEEVQNDVEEVGVKIKDVIKHHKKKNTMIGIDVSRWQGDIDYNKIKKAGVEFVIMRMAVSNGKHDKIGLDSFYKKNILKAKKAGLKVGVYVFTAASSEKEIKEQAKFVRKELNKTKLDFPIAYDFENWDDLQKLKISQYDLTNYVDLFKEEVSKDGYDVMIYGSKLYLEKAWNNKKYSEWLAHYVPNPSDVSSYKGKKILWQICNDGIVDGINGYVDIDIYYKK